MKIIIDAMGGDYAPEVVIEGALAAAGEYQIELVLVGDEPRLNSLLKKYKYKGSSISVYPASEVIEMSESAAITVRRKKNSSIMVGLKLVKEGFGDAFFSAGNTGAVVCAAALTLRLLPGIERPGIAVIAPSLKGISLIIDVGANIDPKPRQLLQYGIMADAYMRYILNKPNPTVGLLNIGEEESKGTDFVKETYELFEKSNLNFIGNVEAKSLFHGKSDIIICDGFVGNVALKVSEGAVEAMQELIRRHLLSNPLGVLSAILLKFSLGGFKKQMDYAEYGGAPLLGLDGIVIIGHGRSSAKAIKNAIRVAKEEVERKFNEKIQEAIKPEMDRAI